MDKIIKDFFKSDLDEAEFFGVSREGSITLEEYRERMQDIDYRFQQMAQFEVFSIRIKCPWVRDVWFEGLQNPKTKEFFLTCIHFFAEDGRKLYTKFDKKTESYNPNLNVPKIYLLNKGVRLDLEREKDFSKIQEELKEIERIGQEVYNDKLHDKISVSENFKAVYRPDGGLYVSTEPNSDHVTAYLKPNVKNYDKTMIKDKDKNKMLKKILLKNN